MTIPEIIFLSVVVLVGIRAWRNLTAVGLVLSYCFVQGAWWLTGMAFNPTVFLMVDLTVLALIYMKPPVYDCWPYGTFWRQLCAAWVERSWWDRAVIVLFLPQWLVYTMPGSDWWWALYYLSLAQFLSAGGEVLFTQGRRSISAPDLPHTPSLRLALQSVAEPYIPPVPASRTLRGWGGGSG